MKSLSVIAFVSAATAISHAQTGAETEKRFPPLKLPTGFEATLFACDPLVEYPSVIALGPQPGTLFVAHDYMTGLGREIVRRDEIHLLEDSDGDGYADKSTLFAGGFNSIQGLEFFDGDVFAMHAPFLTRLRDIDGDGVSDEREDLLTGLGLHPEDNDVRLHCANGVTAGFDGWLYLAIGDHGVDVPRPEGDRLVLNGGGILRCRRDGSDLHLFATGTRNIYDVALDADLNVFIRDNENDGGNFKIRVSHSFLGADHGYPYLFRERPGELLTPLADLGLGSSAGGACYLETQFPVEYRGNTFFAEWGKSIVRHQLTPRESSFAPIEQEHEFAVGDDSDAYPFKPTDVVVDHDGSLLISDWADGQRPKRGRARIYRIRYADGKQATTPQLGEPAHVRLDSASAHERIAAQLELQKSGQAFDVDRLGTLGRIHAVWILADGDQGEERLLELAESDPEPRVRAQAVRALGDLGVVSTLPEIGHKETDSRVLRELTIALGRARWDGLADWIHESLKEPDPVLAHAAKQMLRRTENPAAVLNLLDLDSADPARLIALQALAGWIDAGIADGLISRLGNESDPVRQRQLADLLTRMHRKPGPWIYWEYRPVPRLPNPIEWERTQATAAALNRILAVGDFATRASILLRMQRENIPVELLVLDGWLEMDHNEEHTAAILRALANHPRNATRQLLDRTVRDSKHEIGTRLVALRLLIGQGDADLRKLGATLEDDGVLAEILLQLGGEDTALLLAKLDSTDPHVRAAAIRVLGRLGEEKSRGAVLRLLDDGDASVRTAAASAVGDLNMTEAADRLLAFAENSSDGTLRRESLDALRKLRDPRAIPIALGSLGNAEIQLVALRLLGEIGRPDQSADIVNSVAASNNSELLQLAAMILDGWSADTPVLDRQIADLHGQSAQLLRWKCRTTTDAKEARSLAAAAEKSAPGNSRLAAGPNSSVFAGPAGNWICSAEILAEEATTVQFLASSTGSLELWLNGNRIHAREASAAFRPDSDRANGKLHAGLNTLAIIISADEPVQFHARFRRKSSQAEQERLIQYVLGLTGNPELGRELFFDAEVTQCVLCHRIDGKGGRIGPDLTGAGGRFSQIYLIESILEPSRAVAPGFQTHLVTLDDGRIFLGAKVEEDDDSITIGDIAGQHHRLLKSAVRSREPQAISIMPPGLETRMTQRQFADLLEFLLEQK